MIFITKRSYSFQIKSEGTRASDKVRLINYIRVFLPVSSLNLLIFSAVYPRSILGL